VEVNGERTTYLIEGEGKYVLYIFPGKNVRKKIIIQKTFTVGLFFSLSYRITGVSTKVETLAPI
jgi:hypothetical protein